MKPSFYSAVVVINPQGQVLLGKRREDNKYTSPAGGSNSGESPEQTAVRELFEESGLAAKPFELQHLPSANTKNGKVCHVFLWVSPFNPSVTTKMDLDREIIEWKWYNMTDIPEEMKEDENRFTSVRNAYLKFHGVIKSLTEALEKGGPGSGVRGHVTEQDNKVIKLTNKLTEHNPFKSHLDLLNSGAILEGHQLRSEKPLYLNMEQATAHGYTPEDHREAANIHYDKAQAMATSLEKIKTMGKKIPKEAQGILDFHKNKFRQHMKASEKLSGRMARTDQALAKLKEKSNFKKSYNELKKEGFNDSQIAMSDQLCPKCEDLRKKSVKHDKCIHKSVVMMGHQDAAEVDTGKFAQEHSDKLGSEWRERIYKIMEGYEAAQEPRVIPLDSGNLYLVKVDDGIYTGVYKKEVWVEGTDGNTSGMMEDTAKVRIERMSIPSLVQFLIAKEWITPYKETQPEPPKQDPTVVVGALPTTTEPMDRKLEVLRLLDKLTT